MFGKDDKAPATPEVLAGKRGRLFGGGKKALQEENAELRAALAEVGFEERDALKSEIARLTEERGTARAEADTEKAELSRELSELRQQVLEISDEAILQDVGIYRYRHPLDTALAYKERIDALKAQIKDAARGDSAVTCTTDWTVDNSRSKGEKMVRDLSKLMLRSYNTEADIIVRGMKPYALDKGIERLNKARAAVSRLGQRLQIEITQPYHLLRIQELELTADYLAKAADEKERERAERERTREEEKARREYERETSKLQKERSHYETVIAKLRDKGDTEALAEAEAKLSEIDEAIRGIGERAANIRTGYVYVISNIGSFGERMVKIGMTRRLDPMDRVRELGDASVPFRYDLHAMIFSEDAVTLEGQLHKHFASARVNAVNERREFFYATPDEVSAVLASLAISALEFEPIPEAIEWRQSEGMRRDRQPRDAGTT